MRRGKPRDDVDENTRALSAEIVVRRKSFIPYIRTGEIPLKSSSSAV
jgi:hypothetical protein